MAYNRIADVDARCYQLAINDLPKQELSEHDRKVVWRVFSDLSRRWVHADEMELVDALLTRAFIDPEHDRYVHRAVAHVGDTYERKRDERAVPKFTDLGLGWGAGEVKP